ncbi:TetR/AcrR family transcriptional regulator, partial [Frankia tisae]|uniref:TetR/AcrR family transcriptional regulator n=1 Tax=Frankia tisae TaxID=2950104 RepID=UPI0021C227E5
YERIIAAADQAFEDVGRAVTLEEVARRAGVGVATVYRRFRNRDQLLRAVFDHLVSTEIVPQVARETDDPWRDLVGALDATVAALAGRQVILALARETDAFHVEGVHHYLESMERLLGRARDAGVVRPELERRDLSAVIVMALATVRPDDPAVTSCGPLHAPASTPRPPRRPMPRRRW